MRSLRPVFLSLAVLVGCGEAPPTSTCLPGVEECETPPTEDEVVAGVNLTRLFADATADEIRTASGRRPSSPTAGTVEVTDLPDTTDGARWLLLTLQSGSEAVVQALARVPGPRSSVTRLPVIVVLTDGEDGASADDGLASGPYATLAERTVQVVVAYRGESLQVGDSTFASALEADPYRADVADLLALLPALDQIPRADPGRLGVVGLGRGGTVALLAAQATTAIDAVVTLGAPTDLLGASFRDDVRTLLRGRAPSTPYPALDALAAPAVSLRDGAIDLAEARLQLLSLSPAYDGDALPAVFALHAERDDVVGDDQLTRLDAAMVSAPGVPREAELVLGASHASLPAQPAVQSDIAAFLLDRL